MKGETTAYPFIGGPTILSNRNICGRSESLTAVPCYDEALEYPKPSSGGEHSKYTPCGESSKIPSSSVIQTRRRMTKHIRRNGESLEGSTEFRRSSNDTTAWSLLTVYGMLHLVDINMLNEHGSIDE
jgi:hypothetical protein